MEQLLKEALAAEKRRSELYLTALRLTYGNDSRKIEKMLERARNLNKRFTSVTYKNLLISQSNKTNFIVIEDLATGTIVKIIGGRRKFSREDLKIIGENVDRIDAVDELNYIIAEMEYNMRFDIFSIDEIDTFQIPVCKLCIVDND